MIILGITDGQTSGASIVKNGKLLAAINEERIVRLKQARGFPRESIKAVLDIAGVSPGEIDGVGIAQVNMQFKNDVAAWKGWFEETNDVKDAHNLFFNIGSKFSFLADKVPVSRRLYYALRTPVYRKRRKLISQILREEFSIDAPVRFFDHHYVHAASAYYTSGFDDSLVITLDGGGDGSSGHVYVAKEGRLHLQQKIESFDSLGNYYAYVTAICGYKAKKHEGKITGLAAYGKPIYYKILNGLIAYANGKTVNRGGVLFSSALGKIKRLIGPDFKHEDLASSIQTLSEDICRAHVSYWLQKTGSKRVALAGGVFSNVRINQEIHEIDGLEQTYVHPGMSDEGLAVGAGLAMWAAHELADGRIPRTEMMRDVYLGYQFSDDEIQSAIDVAGLDSSRSDNVERDIARLLADGYVVARFNGAMEYGPRALGNRSILYHPTDRSVNDWLNKNLVRTEFMPFAPSMMAEYADQCFTDVDGAFDTARFMTITFNCTEWMQESCPGVVHVDGTARPQLVRAEDNPSYFGIINEFHKITGLPAIINTSFNMHEEPIVCTPEDAIRAFQLGRLDYLAMGPFVIKNPGELSHPLIAVGHAEAVAAD
ncbi:MAG: carbamoyltransferase [Chloroflexi bacterium]|nr:carbamoyltransferase [Chloroflexota bacterium]